MPVDPNYLTYLRGNRPEEAGSLPQPPVAPPTQPNPRPKWRPPYRIQNQPQPGTYQPSVVGGAEMPPYMSTLPNFYDQATMDIRRNIEDYMYGTQQPQSRVLQQADILFRTSGIEQLQNRLNELDQQAANMSYSERLNEAPDRRRAREAEMANIQQQIQEIYNRIGGYVGKEATAQRYIEEKRKSDYEANQLFQQQEEARRRQAEINRTNAESYRDNLQSMATRGFYQTPYAFQNA